MNGARIPLNGDKMTEIKSDTVKVNMSSQQIIDLLGNLENIKELMPADKIENWKSDGNTCSFKIKGLTEIGMKKTEPESGRVQFLSEGKNPFDFTLNVHLTSQGDKETETQIVFDADMNSFTAMMVKKPLRNLFNMMVEKLAEKAG